VAWEFGGTFCLSNSSHLRIYDISYITSYHYSL
jgi:hypothetical protein